MSQLLQVNIHFFWSSRLHWTLYTQKLCWQKQGGKRWQQISEKPAIPSETNSFVINVVTQIWQFLKDLKNQNVWPIDSQMTFSDSHSISCVSQRRPFGELSEISLWLNYDVVQKDSRFSCDNIYSQCHLSIYLIIYFEKSLIMPSSRFTRIAEYRSQYMSISIKSLNICAQISHIYSLALCLEYQKKGGKLDILNMTV